MSILLCCLRSPPYEASACLWFCPICCVLLSYLREEWALPRRKIVKQKAMVVFQAASSSRLNLKHKCLSSTSTMTRTVDDVRWSPGGLESSAMSLHFWARYTRIRSQQPSILFVSSAPHFPSVTRPLRLVLFDATVVRSANVRLRVQSLLIAFQAPIYCFALRAPKFQGHAISVSELATETLDSR